MEYTFLDFLTLIGSVGLFLYGMKVMSEGLQKVAGDRLRNILAVMTKNRFSGMLTGILITALIQSSSASTVMVVSFVNAGLMTLGQSMAVIMGANVGTTATAWLISLFGFKVDITIFALPLIGLGVPLLFSNKSSRKSWGEFIIGGWGDGQWMRDWADRTDSSRSNRCERRGRDLPGSTGRCSLRCMQRPRKTARSIIIR